MSCSAERSTSTASRSALAKQDPRVALDALQARKVRLLDGALGIVEAIVFVPRGTVLGPGDDEVLLHGDRDVRTRQVTA